MNESTFQIVIRNAHARSTRVLAGKRVEYSPGEDRLSNFKKAGELQGVTPEAALVGMLTKHVVSLFELVASIEKSEIEGWNWKGDVWNEKLDDARNYLFLLEALVRERYGWTP